MTRRFRVLTAALVVLAGACDRASERDVVGPSGIPTRANALQGAGHPIGDGFTVAAGSWLVGGTIEGPQYGHGQETIEGWTAVLMIDEQPLRVLQAYVDQALTAGYAEFGAPFRDVDQFCATDRDLGVSVEPRGTPPTDGAQWVECEVAARRPAGERFDTIFFKLVLGIPIDCLPRCESYARYLELNAAYSTPVTGLSVPCERCGKPDVTSIDLPALPPVPRDLRLADAGEWIGRDQRFFRGFTVEPGSELVAPGAALNSAGTGNFSVILRITGHPRSVLEAYVTQFREICCANSGTDGPSDLRTRPADDSEQLSAYVAALGGLGFSITTTPLHDGRAVFARVDVFND